MPRCLILERHEWETGFGEEQIQMPRRAFEDFFGQTGEYLFNIYLPPYQPGVPTRVEMALVSEYDTSTTWRINRIHEIGNASPCFVFIQEVPGADGGAREFDLWFDDDIAAVAQTHQPWQRGQSNQYGDGRRWTIVELPLQRR